VQPAGRLPGLEALRCAAAVCILLLHTRAVFGGPRVFGKGYLAVEFFLMLSGFLMAYAQEARLARGTAPVDFMVKRYKRLWPTMALGGVIGLPRLYLRAKSLLHFTGMALANLALLPVSFMRECFPLNIPAWTVFYELVANTLHVAVLRHLRLRTICIGIALLVGLAAYADRADIHVLGELCRGLDLFHAGGVDLAAADGKQDIDDWDLYSHVWRSILGRRSSGTRPVPKASVSRGP